MADEVQLTVEGAIAVVRLARHERANAICGTMFDQLRRIALHLSDAPPKYVLITADGPDFSSGLDLDPNDALFKVFHPIVKSRDAFRAQEVIQRMQSSFQLFSRLPCPVIAAIEGRCYGPGLELALAADLRVAGSGASFAMPESKYGILTGFGGMVRLTTLLGAARAHEMLLAGRTWDATHAERVGLVNEVVEAGSAETRALTLIGELSSINPSARLQSVLAVRAIQHTWTDQLLEHERQAAARTWIAGDWQQGLEMAAAGREPDWAG